MSIYDGVVTLDQTDVPVIVELGEDSVRLSASGTEIGNWSPEECHIAHIGDSAYSITAENETLHFVPNQPSLFAAAVGLPVNGKPLAEHVPRPETPQPEPDAGRGSAPPPKPLTMGLFYALCVTTAALALWSLVAIVL